MKKSIVSTLAAIVVAVTLFSVDAAQRRSSSASNNTLYQVGVATLFQGGLFRQGLPVGQLKRQGTFGIAAPAMVDGELIEHEGTVYQTKANGETIQAPDTLQVPFGMVCFFKPDTSFRVSRSLSQPETQLLLEACMPHKNGIYAIRITDVFEHIRTRAFHPVDREPFPSMTSLQANQQLFAYDALAGTMFGFRMPAYMGGVNTAGYHFHFIAEKHDKGGHVLDFTTRAALIEVALIKEVRVEIPYP